MKKIISILSAICMVVTMIPFSAYATDITPEISLDEFTKQLQKIQSVHDDNYVSEITIENDKEFYHIDGEEFPVSDDNETTATVNENDFEIPFSTIEPYVDLPESSTYSLDTENNEDVTVDKETAEYLGFEVDIEDDKAVLTQPYQTERLIVKSKYDINPLDSVAMVEGYNDLHIVQFDNQESTKQAEEYYNSQKLIEYAEPDLVMSTMEVDYSDDDSTFVNSIDSYGSHLSWGSDSIAVDDYIDTLSEIEELPEIVVGIIDTGIDLDHEFLKDRIIETNYNTSSSGEKSSENDDEGHGTHVAGIVADNTTNSVKIKSYKVLNSSGKAPLSSIVAAIDFSVSDGVNVINMSLGAKGESTTMLNAVNKATRVGIAVCVAAGNSGSDASKFTPASIENCITVAAIDEYDKIPYWSNWGEECVNIVAPGVSIYSTYNDGGYETLSGTSMATPFVTASAALLLSKNNSYTRDEICDLLIENGRQWNKGINTGLDGIPTLYIGDVENINMPRTPQPVFNVDSGRYMDSITIEITCDDKDAEIYYTTDGTRATNTNGILYTEPIIVDKVTTLSASAYSPNKLKSIQASAHYYITYLDEETNFEIDSNGVITKYYGSNNYLSVPDTINGITVTSIGNRAFTNSNLVMIKLPNSVKSIFSYAFSNCQSLYSVDANNIITVENNAFIYCNKLELFNFSTVEDVGEYAFASCRSLTSINGNNIKTIEKYAFRGDDKIINAFIPACISIGEWSFTNNMAIEYITMDNVEIIGQRAFQACTHLLEINLPKLKEIGSRAFMGCSRLSVIDIPNYSDTIPNYCFSNSPIEYIYLPKVTALGDYVFSSNKVLKSLYLPNVINIGNNCFDNAAEFNLFFVPNLKITQSLPETTNSTIYLSDSCIELPILEYKYNIIAPIGSYAEQYAKENGHTFIPSDYRDTANDKIDNTNDINVRANGRSIRVTNTGLRFGFEWNKIPEIEELASDIEYGFVYSIDSSAVLKAENADGKTVMASPAPNRIKHGNGETTFNLVFTDIPKAAYNQTVYARAYVCIDGMYFYSNTLNGSFSEVAHCALSDGTLDKATKDKIQMLLQA